MPVLPLDGGRLLRAALETRLGQYSSTIVAAQIGRAGGLLLMAVGFFYDFWLMFIGLFLFPGAVPVVDARGAVIGVITARSLQEILVWAARS